MKRRTKRMNKRKRMKRMIMGMMKLKMVLVKSLNQMVMLFNHLCQKQNNPKKI
jgi:hypothetical protein